MGTHEPTPRQSRRRDAGRGRRTRGRSDRQRHAERHTRRRVRIVTRHTLPDTPRTPRLPGDPGPFDPSGGLGFFLALLPLRCVAAAARWAHRPPCRTCRPSLYPRHRRHPGPVPPCVCVRTFPSDCHRKKAFDLLSHALLRQRAEQNFPHHRPVWKDRPQWGHVRSSHALRFSSDRAGMKRHGWPCSSSMRSGMG